jgi:hypothetical protein
MNALAERVCEQVKQMHISPKACENALIQLSLIPLYDDVVWYAAAYTCIHESHDTIVLNLECIAWGTQDLVQTRYANAILFQMLTILLEDQINKATICKKINQHNPFDGLED